MNPQSAIRNPQSRILVVDDEKSIRRTLGEFLRADGYEVVEAEDADAALHQLNEREFDVVVTDIILPRVTGVELLRCIHATAPHVQVVMMTGEPTVETASESLRAGAADYLFKPITKEAILRVVANAVKFKTLDDTRRRLEAENRAYQENLERLVEERTRQLRASEGRAHELSRFNQGVLDALAAHICVLAEDGTILAVNRGWEDFRAANPPLAANAGVGANYMAVCETVTGGGRAVAQAASEGLRALARGDVPEFSLEYPCHSAETERWFVLRANRLAGEKPVRMVVAHVNITERKQAEEEIRLAHERLKRLVDSNVVGIAIATAEGGLIEANDYYLRLIGFTREEIKQGKVNWRSFTPPEWLPTDERAIRELRERGTSGPCEKEYVRRDGSRIPVLLAGAMLPGPGEQIAAFVLDLTEKKQLEAQFLRAQRLEGVGALASGIAHDLNNVLSPVLMIATLLRDRVQDADSRAMLDTMESCAQRGASIIKQLLTFARGAPGVRVPLTVRHLLRDSDKIITETFPRDIRSRVNTPADLWPLLGDATQVHQVLMNLCVNARDAMPDGGTLTLGAKNVIVDEAFAAMASGAKAGPYVCVTVSDTGTGIPPEDLDRIFDPFFTTKEIGKGTGLGLPTVLGIVRGHGGFLQVDSRLGRGTTFALYFPASPQAQVACTASREAIPPRAQGELIIVVDDEPSVRDCLCRTLESHGYRVVEAAHGAEGLAAFSQHRAQVRAVITDMMMPVMSGPAMINILRALDPHLLILGMSGLPERKGVKGYENVELPVLLAKPFSGDELLRVLHTVLQAPGVAVAKGAE